MLLFDKLNYQRKTLLPLYSMDDSLDLQSAKMCWLECAENSHTAMCQASHSGMFPVLFTELFPSCYSILSTRIMPDGLQNAHQSLP